MNTDLTACARHAIETLAARENVPADEIRKAIQEAVVEAQKDPPPESQLLWATMTPDGSLPSSEQLIAWVVMMLTR